MWVGWPVGCFVHGNAASKGQELVDIASNSGGFYVARVPVRLFSIGWWLVVAIATAAHIFEVPAIYLLSLLRELLQPSELPAKLLYHVDNDE